MNQNKANNIQTLKIEEWGFGKSNPQFINRTMNKFIVKILKTYYVTHDVKCIVVEKPAGYNFISGQATNISIHLPEWENELHPFSFTSVAEQDYLEFMIKIYGNHEGCTKILADLIVGDELIIHDVFGTIKYEGAGIFIAGGTGVTPFISIFRDLHKNNKIAGNKLIYFSKTSSDVIREEELLSMFNLNFVKLFTREIVGGRMPKVIDLNFLIENVTDFQQKFYVCGSDEFVENNIALLYTMGASIKNVVFEK